MQLCTTRLSHGIPTNLGPGDSSCTHAGIEKIKAIGDRRMREYPAGEKINTGPPLDKEGVRHCLSYTLGAAYIKRSPELGGGKTQQRRQAAQRNSKWRRR
jgi:hypothetical protein